MGDAPKQGRFRIQWIDRKREPQCPPNPDYPDGVDINSAMFAAPGPRCFTKLPYPARRCGTYVVECLTCGQNAAITTAGRPDDPRSLTIDCQPTRH